MVNISIDDLRQLHYDSDMLRNIFFDITDTGDGGNTWYREKDNLTRDELESAKEYIIKINSKLIDLDVETENDSFTELVNSFKPLSKGDKILELLTQYFGKYDFIITYGSDRSVTIRKDMVVMFDDYFLYYYASKDMDVPLGVIAIENIIGIKLT